MWVGSASAADHLRCARGRLGCGVAGPGVAARSGAVPAVAAQRLDPPGRGRPGGGGGGGLHRVALCGRGDRGGRVRGAPGGARRPRRPVGASIGPRPTEATPGTISRSRRDRQRRAPSCQDQITRLVELPSTGTSHTRWVQLAAADVQRAGGVPRLGAAPTCKGAAGWVWASGTPASSWGRSTPASS
jgi:hypothetical protein